MNQYTELDTAIREFARDVQVGLSKKQKALSPKYIYDDQGSALFEKIMELPEYYLTRCEYEILNTHKKEIAQLVEGKPFNLIELGAGNGEKTKLLLSYFLDRNMDFTYNPIDISPFAIQKNLAGLTKELPSLVYKEMVAEYFEGLKQLNKYSKNRNLLLFLGSNIGNFDGQSLDTFLQKLHASLNHGDYLCIGFDLKKDTKKIIDAYFDASGITAQFHLNLLKRINLELEADFDVSQFKYYTTYNPFSGAVESFLISQKEQTVHIRAIDQQFHFYKYEPIHTEYSFKYTPSEIEALAKRFGFIVEQHLLDTKKYFTNSIWKVDKGS